MIICSTALLFHVCAIHEVLWEGIGAAWMVAAFMDMMITLFLIYCIFKPGF